jgi:hypothetical protein
VIEDELAPPLEHVEEPRFPVRALEHVALLDSHHWLAAAFGGKRVAGAHCGLLLRHERVVRGFPFGGRNDAGKGFRGGHGGLHEGRSDRVTRGTNRNARRRQRRARYFRASDEEAVTKSDFMLLGW